MKMNLEITTRQLKFLVTGLVCLQESLLDWVTISDLYESESLMPLRKENERAEIARNNLVHEIKKFKDQLFVKYAEEMMKPKTDNEIKGLGHENS
jgi:hypothetical protein